MCTQEKSIVVGEVRLESIHGCEAAPPRRVETRLFVMRRDVTCNPGDVQ